MAKTYNWTEPLVAPANPALTLQADGSLDADTTYYYRVVAVNNAGYVIDRDEREITSPACAEVSDTTDATNKTIRVDWDAVAGAAAYYVFRSTTSDMYSYSRRFRRLSDNNNGYPTTTDNFMTDDGTYGLYSSSYIEVMPADSPYPLGLDYLNVGRGSLEITGGTSGDPITFSDIYDDFVANVAGYEDHIYYDGQTFGFLGNIDLASSTETHFKETLKTFVLIGVIDVNLTHTDSNFQMGEIDSNGEPVNGVDTKFFGGYYAGPEFIAGYKFYKCKFQSAAVPYWKNGSGNIMGSGWFALTNGISQDCDVDEFTFFGLQGDRPYKNLYVQGANVGLSQQTDVDLLDSIKATYINFYYTKAGTKRTDNCTVYLDTYQYRIRDDRAVLVKAVDPISPSSTNSEKLPVIRWDISDDNFATFETFFSMILRVVDTSEVGLSATVSILDSNTDPALDFDDSSLSGLTTNSDGYLFKDTITTTSSTTTTITDSSKSWDTDEWKGRNVYCYEGQNINMKYKVLSNTATVLTLTTTMPNAPDVGDKFGVIYEVKRNFLVHKAGSGSGAGDDYTTTTDYSPFNIKISKSGYISKNMPLTLNKPINDIEVLEKVKDLNYSSKGKLTTQ